MVNIGTGHEISIGETVELLADLMGVSVTVIQDNLRERPAASEVERLVACTSRARELFGWEPEYVGREGLSKALLETAEWFQDSANLARYKPSAYNL